MLLDLESWRKSAEHTPAMQFLLHRPEIYSASNLRIVPMLLHAHHVTVLITTSSLLLPLASPLIPCLYCNFLGGRREIPSPLPEFPQQLHFAPQLQNHDIIHALSYDLTQE